MKWALKPGHCQFYYSNGTATPTYNYGLSWIIMDNASSQVTNKRMQKMLKYLFCSKKQRCVGVEPTRDRAERPPSRFEDGETHRGLYTSMHFQLQALLCHVSALAVKLRASTHVQR